MISGLNFVVTNKNMFYTVYYDGTVQPSGMNIKPDIVAFKLLLIGSDC